MPEAFHFLQPLWFWTLLPALLLLWLLRKSDTTETAWRRVCDAGLLPFLLTRPGSTTSRLPLWLLGTGWLLAVIALADPVWEKQPQPVFRNEAARVVVLDLSNSMLSPDLKPSRMVRARYKVADILNQDLDGQTGLVVFAGNAFVVTPLTSDVETIRALLSPLEPALMPAQGSRVDLGLQKAGHLLRQAGLQRGDILLVTDGYDGQRAIDAAAELQQQGYRVSVLGVGTDAGAPIPVSGGGFLRDSRGDIVLPALDQQALQALATAGGGGYATISNSEADIKRLLRQSAPALDEVVASNDRSTDVWQSRGPLMLLLLLPLAALAFRRGWLLLVLVTVSATLSIPQPAMAFGWDDLWLRADQQAARALQAGDPEQAAKLADDPALRGTAAYQAGDYEQAVDAFTGSAGSDADYNQGNALAKLERYEAAIAAYDRALAKQAGMADAEHNKAEVEKLLQQQEQQQEQQKDQKDQNGQQDQQDQQDQQGQQNEGGEQDADQQQTADGSQDDTGEQGEQQDEAAGEQQQSAEEEETAAKEQQAAQQEAGDKGEQGDQQAQAAEANPLDSEEKQAAEQWLRRIPDDPGGLLRRKFLYQYRQQGQGVAADNQQAW